MNFGFFGTDEFSVKVLDTLKNKGLIPALIVTTPDQPKGRKLVLTPPPVKVWAEKSGIEMIQLASLKNLNFSEVENPRSDLWAASRDPTSKKEGFDFFLVASYGKIIPQEILDIPKFGTLNIHPSLLPKYRGPSPIETAILNGDTETGVTIIKLDAEMDHGDIVAQEKIALAPDCNFEKLRDRLAILGAELLAKILPDYLANQIKPKEQNHGEATFTKKFIKTDSFLDPQSAPKINYRKILAFTPRPGAYTDHQKIHIIIRQAHLDGDELVYDRVVPAGRKEMAWADFLNGLRAMK